MSECVLLSQHDPKERSKLYLTYITKRNKKKTLTWNNFYFIFFNISYSWHKNYSICSNCRKKKLKFISVLMNSNTCNREKSKNGTWNSSIKVKWNWKIMIMQKKCYCHCYCFFYKLFDLQKIYNVIVFFFLPIKKDRHGGIELDYFRTNSDFRYYCWIAHWKHLCFEMWCNLQFICVTFLMKKVSLFYFILSLLQCHVLLGI